MSSKELSIESTVTIEKPKFSTIILSESSKETFAKIIVYSNSKSDFILAVCSILGIISLLKKVPLYVLIQDLFSFSLEY